MPRPAFAYLFERFPSFTQTFTVREVQGVMERGLLPRVYSIRRPEGEPPQDFPAELSAAVRYLPEVAEMRTEIRALKDTKRLPKPVAAALRELNESGEAADKTRFYEAAWLGLRLREEGIRHVHVHFAGIAARTAFWIKRLYGIAFSFTAHANDFLVKGDYKITLEDLAREASFIVHVSDFGRGEMAAHFPAQAGKMITIYNGLNIKEYSRVSGEPQSLPPAWLAEPNTPLILSVGRLIEKKGFGDLIAACKLLSEKMPFRCAIVGDGPLLEELKVAIARSGLGDRVALLGNQPQGEIRLLLRKCTVFALACVREADGGMDNLPTVITEAMAASRAVVSTRLAGVPEQVIDGKTGYLVEPGDVPSLAEALAKAIPLREAVDNDALERAETVFSIEVTTAQLTRALIARGSACPPLGYTLLRPWLWGRLF